TGGTLFVANLDGSSAGAILTYDYFAAPVGVLASGLSGAFALALDADGETLLVSGGRAADGSGTVVAIGRDGHVTELARSFAFATEMFFDPGREELLVLDAGAREVTAICADHDGDERCDADDPCTRAREVREVRLALG